MQERETGKVIQRGDRRYIQKYAHEIRKEDILLWDGGKTDLEVVTFVKGTFRSIGRVRLTIEYIYPLSVQVAAQNFLASGDVQSVDFERHTIVMNNWYEEKEQLFILLKQTSKE